MFHEFLSSWFYDFYPHLLIRKKACGKAIEYVIIIFTEQHRNGCILKNASESVWFVRNIMKTYKNINKSTISKSSVFGHKA